MLLCISSNSAAQKLNFIVPVQKIKLKENVHNQKSNNLHNSCSQYPFLNKYLSETPPSVITLFPLPIATQSPSLCISNLPTTSFG